MSGYSGNFSCLLCDFCMQDCITCLSYSQILKNLYLFNTFILDFFFFAYNVIVIWSHFLSCRTSHFKPLRLTAHCGNWYNSLCQFSSYLLAACIYVSCLKFISLLSTRILKNFSSCHIKRSSKSLLAAPMFYFFNLHPWWCSPIYSMSNQSVSHMNRPIFTRGSNITWATIRT